MAKIEKKYLQFLFFTFTVLGLVLLMLRLGVWQLDRAEQNNAIAQKMRALANQPPIDLNSIAQDMLNGASVMRYRKITAKGKSALEPVYLLDNKVHKGRVGYNVYSLFVLNGGDKAVLINRGWLANALNKHDTIAASTLQVLSDIQGRLNFAPAKPPLWNDKYQAFDGQRWQYFPMAELSAQIKQKYQLDLLPLVVELDAQDGESQWVRSWKKIDDSAANKNWAYSFMWFSMAGTLLLLSLIALVKRIKRK